MLRQDFLRFPTTADKSRGQALVEFALTILAFLMLLVMIIEVGRILWAYVTLQHAARSGARYAVTGQWEENYAIDADAHFDASSQDPLNHIPPCWPRFGDDPLSPTVMAYAAYEPYRNARTCSVEATALQQMEPLPLDPFAPEGQPGWYRVRINGVADDMFPTTGTFYRQSPTTLYQYSSYFTDASHAGDNFGWSPGYGGRPEGTVAVRAEHRLPIITPLLSRIAPSIRLQATAIMTNEAYGSTGVQREAILPPEIPNVAPFAALLPADLVITDIQFAGADPDNMETGVPQPFAVTVSNVGDIQAAPAFVVRLYAVPQGTTPPALPWTPGIGDSAPIPPLMPGTPVIVEVNALFPAEGQFDVWAWVDADDARATGVVDEVGTGDDQNPLGETNNTFKYTLSVLVGDLVDLWVTKTASPTTPDLGADFTYRFEYGNNGLSDATNVTITDDLPGAPGEMAFVGSTGSCGESGGTVTCSLGTLTPGAAGSVEITVRAEAPALSGIVLPNTAVIGSSAGETETHPADNTSTANIVVEGVDVSVAATVDNAEPLPEETITFTATVSNASANVATNVPVRITLDDGINATNFSPSTGAYDSGTGVWTISNLTNGAPATMTITATVEPTTEVLEATFEVQDTTPTNVGEDVLAVVALHVQQADLRVTKQVEPEIAAVTEEVVYTLSVTNAGPDDATGVRVVDVLPAELQYESHSGDGTASFDSGSRTVTWNVGDLAASATATLTINTELLPTPVGTVVTNSIAAEDVTLDQFDPTPGNNQPSVDFEVREKADLALTGSVAVDGVQAPDRAAATVGQVVTVTLTVTNNGPSDATGVVVTGAIPPGLLSALVNPDISGDVNPSNGDWTVGPLARDESRTLTVSGVVAPRGTRTAYLTTARATVAEPAVDLLQNNNSFPLHIILSDTLADISLAVTPATQEAPYGSTVSFTVRVTNNGPTDATGLNVSLEDFLTMPDVLDLVPIDPAPQGNMWVVGNLAAGDSQEITITGEVVDLSLLTHGPRTYAGTVSATLAEWDPTPATAPWELNVLPPLPQFFNVGSSACNTMTWGNPSGGLQNGHPLIGHDVQWELLVVSDGGQRASDPVYAPATGIYPSGRGAEITAGDENLFWCHVSKNQNFGFNIPGLLPGRYRVTVVLYEPNTNESPTYTVRANQTVIFNNNNLLSATGGTRIYYITQGGPATVGEDGILRIDVTAKGVISGVGLEYLGLAD